VVASVLRYTQQLRGLRARGRRSVVATVQELRLDAMRNRKQTERLQEQMGRCARAAARSATSCG
jgi:hypothetical protein